MNKNQIIQNQLNQLNNPYGHHEYAYYEDDKEIISKERERQYLLPGWENQRNAQHNLYERLARNEESDQYLHDAIMKIMYQRIRLGDDLFGGGMYPKRYYKEKHNPYNDLYKIIIIVIIHIMIP